MIIGLLLIKNEDLWIRNSILNILHFCDKIYVYDHNSQDQTSVIIRSIVSNKIQYHKISDPRKSHEVIAKYANSKNWIFGVDGDEIYDPSSLIKAREIIISGKWDSYFVVKSHALHATFINEKYAEGYMCPPSKSVTKLYNMTAVKSWSNVEYERLHGGNIVFNNGFYENKQLLLWGEYTWQNTPIKCLHMCFQKRSSLDLSAKMRLSPCENPIKKSFYMIMWKYFSFAIRGINYGKQRESARKKEQYTKGDLVRANIEEFNINNRLVS